jgi:exopolysaccharide biosynthesis polyprenyl glycosylphosphotransferase
MIGDASGAGHARSAGRATARIKWLPLRMGLPAKRDAVFRRLLAVADLMAAACGVAAVATLSDRPMPAVSYATVPLIVIVAKVMGRYDRDEVVVRKSTMDEVPALLSVAGAYALLWSCVAFAAGLHTDLAGGGVFVLWATTSALLIAGRTIARAVAQLSAPLERVLIVGDDGARDRLARALNSDPGARIEVAGMVSFHDRPSGESLESADRHSYERLEKLIPQLDIDRVFLAPSSSDSEPMRDALRRTMEAGVKVTIVPRLLEVVGSAVEFDIVGGVTLLGVRRSGLSRSSFLIKRATDIIGSSVGVCLLAPVGALLAVAIKLDSPGPVFFRQQRIGRDGRPFEMLKFRSMFDGAEAQRTALEDLNESEGTFKLSRDPRVTRVGRLMRRRSLDELPQLVNVLRGEMSLVGPRPLIGSEDQLVVGRDRGRLTLLPGMTGPWQVLGPARPTLSEMVKTDYLYGATWSLWTDVKILLRTLSHALTGRGI